MCDSAFSWCFNYSFFFLRSKSEWECIKWKRYAVLEFSNKIWCSDLRSNTCFSIFIWSSCLHFQVEIWNCVRYLVYVCCQYLANSCLCCPSYMLYTIHICSLEETLPFGFPQSLLFLTFSLKRKVIMRMQMKVLRVQPHLSSRKLPMRHLSQVPPLLAQWLMMRVSQRKVWSLTH